MAEQLSLAGLKLLLVRDLLRFSKVDDHIQIMKDSAEHFDFRIFTDNNRYSITARAPHQVATSPGDRGYLGCIAVSRKPRAGEDWERGSDLADGPLTIETWHTILGDIVSYEMVRVHKRQEPMADGVAAQEATFQQQLMQQGLECVPDRGMGNPPNVADPMQPQPEVQAGNLREAPRWPQKAEAAAHAEQGPKPTYAARIEQLERIVGYMLVHAERDQYTPAIIMAAYLRERRPDYFLPAIDTAPQSAGSEWTPGGEPR